MTRSLQIVLVSTDELVRNRIQSEFGERSNSFEILTATNPTEVIDLMDSRSIDCIVSSEPVTSDRGKELIQSVRNETPDIPFVLFTSDCTPADISTALTEGITQFVPRSGDNDPYSLLAEQVQRIIDRYRTCERASEVNYPCLLAAFGGSLRRGLPVSTTRFADTTPVSAGSAVSTGVPSE